MSKARSASDRSATPPRAVAKNRDRESPPARRELPIAVAIRYLFGAHGEVPRLVASGYGHVAERIIAAAREARVPVRSDRDLARSLVDLPVGVDIPEDLWELVAVLLAEIYTLDARRGGQQ